MDELRCKLAEALARGRPLADAAAEIQLPISKAAAWLHDPSFTDLVASYMPSDADIRQSLQNEVVASIRTMASLRDSAPDPKVRLAAAKDLLEKAGYSAIRRIAVVRYTPSKARTDLMKATLVEETH